MSHERSSNVSDLFLDVLTLYNFTVAGSKNITNEYLLFCHLIHIQPKACEAPKLCRVFSRHLAGLLWRKRCLG